jgi:hypothetical protein
MLVQYCLCIIWIKNKYTLCHKLHKRMIHDSVPVFYSFHLTHVYVRECLMVICALYVAIEGPTLCSHSFVGNNDIWKVYTFICLSSVSCILLCDALRHSYIILFKLSVCLSVNVVSCNQYCENRSFSSMSKCFCSVHNWLCCNHNRTNGLLLITLKTTAFLRTSPFAMLHMLRQLETASVF